VSDMRVGYLECCAGISGDMLMAAMVDAGVSIARLQDAAASLALGAELRVSKVDRSGIQAAKVDVVTAGGLQEPPAASGPVSGSPDQPLPWRESEVHSHSHHEHHAPGQHRHDLSQVGHHSHGRSFAEIRRILLKAPLEDGARRISLTAFELLAEAEARVHGKPVEDVHFHEVGAVDAIVDIVCCAVAAEELAVSRWYCSPVNVGGGFVDCAHGRYPVPAPATALLLMHVPCYSAGPQVEMVTPTGAALLRALDCRFDQAGVMRAGSIGYGAGTRNPERFPNVLRLTIGDIAETQKFNQEKVTVLECAIDDQSPQVLAYAVQRVMERGALDAMSTPVVMKKGRLGTLLTVLSKPENANDLQELLLRETTTLGVRFREENRFYLDRDIVPVETEFGVIRMKAGRVKGEVMNVAPEFEDCRRAAETYDVPLKAVTQAALGQWCRGLAIKAGAGTE
jgi:pyridinium-3,5-bisthiocarboxylic acid mononucleotide nickel chelatase